MFALKLKTHCIEQYIFCNFAFRFQNQPISVLKSLKTLQKPQTFPCIMHQSLYFRLIKFLALAAKALQTSQHPKKSYSCEPCSKKYVISSAQDFFKAVGRQKVHCSLRPLRLASKPSPTTLRAFKATVMVILLLVKSFPEEVSVLCALQRAKNCNLSVHRGLGL